MAPLPAGVFTPPRNILGVTQHRYSADRNIVGSMPVWLTTDHATDIRRFTMALQSKFGVLASPECVGGLCRSMCDDKFPSIARTCSKKLCSSFPLKSDELRNPHSHSRFNDVRRGFINAFFNARVACSTLPVHDLKKSSLVATLQRRLRHVPNIHCDNLDCLCRWMIGCS